MVDTLQVRLKVVYGKKLSFIKKMKIYVDNSAGILKICPLHEEMSAFFILLKIRKLHLCFFPGISNCHQKFQCSIFVIM